MKHSKVYDTKSSFGKSIRKRVLTVLLAIALFADSLLQSGEVLRAFAQEANIEDDTAYEFMQIKQATAAKDSLYTETSEGTFDAPIALTASSKIRLSVSWNTAAEGKREDSAALPCPYEGVLTWSILRGEKGTAPGTENLMNAKDDWTDFETVFSSLLFSAEEEGTESDGFYKTLLITTNDLSVVDSFDYYIRATFQYSKEQTECTAVTTVPVIVAEESGEPSRTTGEEAETAEPEEETAEPEEETAESEEETAEPEEETAESEEETAESEEETAESEEETAESEEETAELEEETAESEDAETAEETEGILFSDERNTEVVSAESAATVIGISKVSLNKLSETMNPGETLKPIVTIVPEGTNHQIDWSSSNSAVAAVDASGSIRAIDAGCAEITAECGGKTASIMIDVVTTDAEKNNDQPKDEEGNIIAVSDEIWIAGFERESEALVYTGEKITQKLRIYHKGTLLKEKTDYVLTYKNNINAAAYNSMKAPSVTVTMKGQYAGGRTLYFTIAPREIDEENSLGYEQVIYYSKQLKLSAPTLYYGGKKLVFNKDFTCDYSSLPQNYTKGDSYEGGVSYEYTVNGKNNFKGSFIMKMTVIKDKNLDFGKAEVSFDKKQYEYHGISLSAEDVKIASLKLGKTILNPELYEYQVCAEDVGTNYVEVYPSEKGRSAGYRGTKTLKIKVVGDRKMRDTKLGGNWQDILTFSQKELNDNGGICQGKTGVLVYREGDKEEPLTEGIDYTVKYTNHKKVGTATLTFTGKGRYTGSFKKTYKIVPNTELKIKWHHTNESGVPMAFYSKGGAVPQFDLLESSESETSYVLKNKTDYTVFVANNKKPGIMTCTIVGKGNYKGYKSVTELEVGCGDIEQAVMTVSDREYSEKKDAWKAQITVTDINGKKLKAGTDYDKQLIYSYDFMETGTPPEAGTIIYVTAVGINNYEGSSITGSYRIYSVNINKLFLLIDEQEYTGKDIELSAEDIHVYASRNDAKKRKEMEELCYEIIGYSNNRKAGTAKVTLRGIGVYGGTKTYSFKIIKKKYLTTRVTKISLDEATIALGVGNERALSVTVSPEDAWNKTVLWTTSNSKIATVSEEGVITAKQPGKINISAISQDTGKKAVCKVQVLIIPITSFLLNTEEIKQYEGTQYQLSVTELCPEDATRSTIQWESTNPEIASVDDSGKVSLKKAGMAVIKAYTKEHQVERKCMVFVESREEAESEPEGTYLTPQMFRTFEEDDDTKAFNKAIENISDECNTVYIPAGTYKIDALTGIRLRSNMKFIMSPHAVLQAYGNSSKWYHILRANSIGNVTISGGQIIGERYEHRGKYGEWGMGIGLYDSVNINISDVTISKCWGDGIYIGSDHEEEANSGCRLITITNCNVYDNRRNNLSIVSADYVTVDNCIFSNANGTAPEYGIDIETNNSNNPCEHITISNSSFNGNRQASIGIITIANDINISGCTLNGPFINYSGTNVTISNSEINAKMYARIGVSLVNGTKINEGSAEEDLLIASFSAVQGPYTIGKYNIDASNAMSYSVVNDSDSPSGKALRLQRKSKGTKEAGYYFNLSELTGKTISTLEKGVTYRFEYVVRGSGQWGIKTDQTCWYPCAPTEDKFSTCVTTYKADPVKARPCRVILYAIGKTKDMYLEVDSIKIYKVK